MRITNKINGFWWLCILIYFLQPGFIAAAENEFGNKIGSPVGGFAQRDAEMNKVLRVHRKLSRNRDGELSPHHAGIFFRLNWPVFS
jgi:hypothetical protein